MRMRDYVAKRIDNGEWVDGDVLNILDGSGKVYILEQKIDGKKWEVDPKTVSQCTGRTDERRYYIFENDIVEEAGGHRSVVKWFADEAKFILESKSMLYDLSNRRVTVIGNIFDNADLIENA